MKTLPHDETGSYLPDPSEVARIEVAFIEGAESAVSITWGRARPSPVAVGHALRDAVRPPGLATLVPNRFFRHTFAKLPTMRWPGVWLEG